MWKIYERKKIDEKFIMNVMKTWKKANDFVQKRWSEAEQSEMYIFRKHDDAKFRWKSRWTEWLQRQGSGCEKLEKLDGCRELLM